MILRDSEFKGSSSVDEAVRLARSSRGYDSEGYRSEFIRLMELARDLGVMAER
jgi:Ca-activated chloride channel family protein